MPNVNLGITAGVVFDESGANVTFKLSDVNKAIREAVVSKISGTWDQEDITAADLDGTIAKVIADDNVIGGIPVLHRIDFAGSTSGTTNYNVTLTHKTRIVLAIFLLKAAGTAGDTLQVLETGNAITEAVRISTNQKEPVLYEISCSGGSDTDYDQVVDDAFRVTDIYGVLEAAGTAGDTLQVKKSGTVISDSIDLSVIGNRDLFRFGEVDDASGVRDFAAGDTIRVTQAGGADSPACKVYVAGYKTGGNDKYIYIAKTYDDAEYEIPAAGTLRVAQVDGGSSDCPAGTAYILGFRV